MNGNRRIMTEIRDMLNCKDPNISASPLEGNTLHWNAIIKGPDGTPYQGGAFKLDIRLPNDYPFKPPVIKFVTKIYHCNISNSGEICLDTLKDGWSPALTIEKTLMSLIGLLENPNPDDPLSPHIAREMITAPTVYLQKAQESTITHALDNIVGIENAVVVDPDSEYSDA